MDDVLNHTDDHLKQFGITSTVPENAKKNILVKLKELETHIRSILINQVDWKESLEELQLKAIQFVKENSRIIDFEKKLKASVSHLPVNFKFMMEIMMDIVSDQLKV